MWRSSLGLLLLLKGVECGQYCKQYFSEYTYWYTTYYCDGRCCGSIYDDECCDDRSGYIAAAVIGGIVGFIILASVIVCIIKACTKQKTGRVIGPSSNLFIVSGASHYGRPRNNGPQGGFLIPQPPPYTAGPAPAYSPYDRFDPGPSRDIRSPPPAYTRAVQTTIGGTTSPAGDPAYPPNSHRAGAFGGTTPVGAVAGTTPVGAVAGTTPAGDPIYPPISQPAGSSVTQNPGLPLHNPASAVPQDATGRPPATAPTAGNLPTNPAGTGGTGTN